MTRVIRELHVLVDGAPDEAGRDQAGQHFGAKHDEPCSAERREKLDDVGGESPQAS